MTMFELGPKLEWDPLDDSEKNQELGRVIFGHQLERIIEIAKEARSHGAMLIADVDRDRGIVMFKKSKECGPVGRGS